LHHIPISQQNININVLFCPCSLFSFDTTYMNLLKPKTIWYYTYSALIVGKDYPHPEGLDYVRRKWKEAIRSKDNCQLLDEKRTTSTTELSLEDITKENERIIRKAVGKGRYVIREMEGTIQLKKYRTMRRRYGEGVVVGETNRMDHLWMICWNEIWNECIQ